jgi:hypothetical protein
MLEIRKTPQELLEWAEEDELFDISDRDSRLSFFLTIGIFEDGPDITKVIKWLEDSGYPLEEGYEKKLHTFMANLYKQNVIVDGMIKVSDDPPSTMDLILTMLAARGFIEMCETKE